MDSKAPGAGIPACTPDLVSCSNAPLCGTKDLPVWVANLHEGRCTNCDMIYMCNFAFSDAAAGDWCPVCLQDNCPLYMTYNCGHKVCVGCFSSVSGTMDGRAPPKPEEYGCPTLAPYMENDEQYEVIMEEWEHAFPNQYAAYSDADNVYQDEVIEYNVKKKEVMQRCPICSAEGNPMATYGNRAASYRP